MHRGFLTCWPGAGASSCRPAPCPQLCPRLLGCLCPVVTLSTSLTSFDVVSLFRAGPSLPADLVSLLLMSPSCPLPAVMSPCA